MSATRTIVIVGGSRGIGAAVAQQAKAAGNRVVVLSRTEPPFEVDQYLPWDALSTDVSVFSQITGPVDGLVYAPGSILLKPFNRFTDANLTLIWRFLLGQHF
jgi:NAD(P)-dependent dehydrogenase (short-subunit alcohol dehydrogenase family)